MKKGFFNMVHLFIRVVGRFLDLVGLGYRSGFRVFEPEEVLRFFNHHWSLIR
jgi:hypothetical protein